MIPLVDPDGGGLYPDGRNTPPDSHLQIGIDQGRKIQKVNKQGQPDAKGKKVIFIGPTMSNGKRKGAGLVEAVRQEYGRSKDFTIFNGGYFGRDLTYLYKNWNEYEAWVLGRFANTRINISPLQVGVVWMTNSVKGQDKPADEVIAEAQFYYEFVYQKVKKLFPMMEQFFVSSSGCSFYSKKPHLRSEPSAGLEGHGVKAFVASHLGERPYVDWAWYGWGDGPTPRQYDGLRWLPEHFAADNLHPSLLGAAVWGKHLLEFFKTSPATAPWFAPK